MTVTQRVFKLMEATSTTAAQLTRKATLTNGVITQWKQGKQKPSLDAIIKIAQYFNVSTDYLLGLTDSVTPPQGEVINKNVEENKKMAYTRFASFPFNTKLKALRKEKRLIEKQISSELEIPLNIYKEIEAKYDGKNPFKGEVYFNAISKLKKFYADIEDFVEHDNSYLEDFECESELSDKLKGIMSDRKLNSVDFSRDVANAFELEQISVISWISGERSPDDYWIDRLSNYLREDLTKNYTSKKLDQHAATSPQNKGNKPTGTE